METLPPRQQEIVLVAFPFSDGSQTKIRPALVLSNNTYNRQSRDVLICALTTKNHKSPYSTRITPKDAHGELHHTSFARSDALARTDNTHIIKRLGTLNDERFDQVTKKISSLIQRT